MTAENDKTQGPVNSSGELPAAAVASPVIFVSYASQDVELAEALVGTLEEQGFRCWIAPRDVDPGTLYADAIIAGINHSNAFVLILSESAVASAHVGKELERASSKRKPILVLRINKTPLTRTFEYFLSESQWIEVGIGGISSTLAKVADAVRHLEATRRQDGSDSVPAARSSPVSNKKMPWSLIVLGILGILGVVWFLISRTLPNIASVSAPVNTQALAPAVPEQSVAVLPFTDMSEKKDQEFFSDGLSEEIIEMLSAVPDLKVPPRSSSFHFKGQPTTLADIAKALGVAHVLEGSVRRSGDNLRVTAQLIRADSGHRLWSQTFDRKADDILKIQDDIARAVVGALKGRLTAGLLPESTGTKSAEAFSLYFQANQLFRQALSEDDTRRALAQVKKSLELDPQFAQALALQSAVFADLGMRPEARQAVDRALELNPSLAVAHFALARFFIGDYDIPGSEKELRRALEIDPELAGALDTIALFEAFRGQFTQSIETYQRVIAMDPVNPQRYSKLALVYFYAGRFPESLATDRRMRELQPDSNDPHQWSSTILFAQGNAAAALAELDLVANENQRLGCGCRTQMLDALGRKTEANAALARLIEAHARDEAYGIASVYASRGDANHAFEWLDRAYAQREFALYGVKIDSDFKALRNDPRFHAILVKLNLI
jgi:TolB-like protein/Flp pilus assembly protein TadD